MNITIETLQATSSRTPSTSVVEGGRTILCPACGGLNAAEAVFCANPACGKALGEFRYVREEIERAARWHESLADRVGNFIARPHFLVVHAGWFLLWVAVNTGVLAVPLSFDRYPFGLLGILLSVETIFITGFLLIRQNRQNARSDLRAELDYEINVRTYREIKELHGALRALSERLERLERETV